MLSLNLPEGALSELLYPDDLVLMSEKIEGLMDMFRHYVMSYLRCVYIMCLMCFID